MMKYSYTFFNFGDFDSVISTVSSVFKYYGQYSKDGFAKDLEGELHGSLEDCLMTLGEEPFILACVYKIIVCMFMLVLYVGV